MRIREVCSSHDRRKFIRFPYDLYRNHPIWIPPLRTEERKKFSPRRNPYLNRCDYAHFLAEEGGRTVGRISAFIDPLSMECWGEKTGMFGSYECEDTAEAARGLLGTAAQWLEAKGVDVIRGPLSFESQEWGFLAGGFDTPPMVMAPYNPPYYLRHMEDNGFSRVKDLLVYTVDDPEGYVLPGRFQRMADHVERKYGVTVRPLNMDDLRGDVRRIVEVSNASTMDNWGFIPVTDEEAEDMAQGLKQAVDPDLILFAEAGGKTVGYLITLPDINTLLAGLDGRLFPRGLYRFLFRRKHISGYRVWALGIVPEYQRKALDTLFYCRLYNAMMNRPLSRIEANYILEDNMPMNNPLKKMGFREAKRYRVFECGISENNPASSAFNP